MTETRKHRAVKNTQTSETTPPKARHLDAIVESMDSDHAHLNVPGLIPGKIAWPLSQLSETIKVGDKLTLTLGTHALQAFQIKEKTHQQTLEDLRKLLEELVN
ncbi:MAG: hypothetical protein ACD_28C00410G0001 [uncultured bacterium]|nr:MAG: hypothetical protein ACD_28C00410G0001 [uncultured bacterium]KKT76951.1 MAG: hypothetical protein UW70_C0007G0008 [Candidatus Peregrinibacteria bacterium GW2011_GWA2_44_7]